MVTLDPKIRRRLESEVIKARDYAEEGARKAVRELAVDQKEAWSTMTPEQRMLRNRLRAHGRQLGDRRDQAKGTQTIERLVTECAYEHWHRMLFARFLAENDLLVEPETKVAISLEECRELARERGLDWLTLASDFAVRMLSQIFRADDPVLEVTLPPETRQKLEKILEDLPRDVFIADDSLGWVYQFWQTAEKDRVNKSENKIGADELPAVTQLFTEDYMVLFLLHNTLGAWWAGKYLAGNPELARNTRSEEELRVACGLPGIEWIYLRFVRSDDDVWRPAAGTFEGWPKTASEITLLDPCMGSGHFLVFALPILVAFRMSEEGLSCEDAVYAVLRDNLFGLEIDPRCTQIAAFNLALAAWRMAGYQSLPLPQLACSGLSLGVSKSEWLKLAERVAAVTALPPKRDLFGGEDNLFSARIKDGFEHLYDLFAKAPWIGSLLNPRAMGGDMFAAGFKEMEPLLASILSSTGDDEMAEAAVAAQGMAKAAELLGRKFTLVATNVPYLGRGKQDEVLRDYCERMHTKARADLATCFVERCIEFCCLGGSIAIVVLQNGLFLGGYKDFRKRLLEKYEWNFAARLGSRAFETITGEIVKVALIELTIRKANANHMIAALDATDAKTPAGKAEIIMKRTVHWLSQQRQLNHPDSRLIFGEALDGKKFLAEFVESYQGAVTGDLQRFTMFYWEIENLWNVWEPFRTSIEAPNRDNGLMVAIRWEGGNGELEEYARISRTQLHDMHESGQRAWGEVGVAINRMRGLHGAIYRGMKFDNNVAVLVPREKEWLLPILCFCNSADFGSAVRKLDQTLKVTNQTFRKVPFDLDYWEQVATEQFPHGLPKPLSDDPTQWLFDGHPYGAEQPLQVAVARLLGYQWPRQTGSELPDCPALKSDGLGQHADEDGIVCLTPLRGEASAADRLRALLADAFGGEWSAAKQNELLADAGFVGKSLEDWLRDGFFEKHCEVFQQRPFIWHVWDGLRNGFSALVNYHKLAAPNGEGRRTLEKLLYTYLGDWIDRQRADQKNDVEGADARVAAAEHLKRELEKILHGESPYDIFVRWKPLHAQSVGWEPDINDGVRINIRPFMTARPLSARAKNACILRVAPKNIKWDKDRGKEPYRDKEDFPWFWGWDGETNDFAGGKAFDGNRWNDLHYSHTFKQAARKRKRG